MKWLIVFASLFYIVNDAHAEIYKCVGPDGLASFQDTPCPDTADETTVTINGNASTNGDVSTQDDDKSIKNSFDKRVLVGKWCEFAVSMSRGGTKDTSMPATWHFKNKSQISYTYKTQKKPKKEIFNQYTVEEEKITIDNLGQWRVDTFNGYSLILTGPIGGYFYLRRGAC
ncbi:MAG: DUF4124 domain-containing protein [Gammaproteobacteria bacterium]|nr:DUF4124 domain-containing protein [Gammaproteobacteria bacterium]